MTRDQIMTHIQKAFGHLRRPKQFIRGTCSCDECREHEAVMQTFNRDSLPLHELDKPSWDPICFASNKAFAYLMPGLAGLVLDHADAYVSQFIFHTGQPERMAAYTPAQARALIHLLEFLVLHEASALDRNMVVDNLYGTRAELEQIAGVITVEPEQP